MESYSKCTKSSLCKDNYGDKCTPFSISHRNRSSVVYTKDKGASLCYKSRPKLLHNFIGHHQVLGPNTYVYMLLKSHEIPNMILWGPPGCGKSTLCNIIKELCFLNPHKYDFIEISCIKELKLPTSHAKTLVICIDEIKNFSKKSQRVLMAHLKSHSMTLVASTTENPSFLLITDLLEHCRVVTMDKLRKEDLVKIIKQALDDLKILIIDDFNTIRNFCISKSESLCIQNSSVEWLASTCDGDARIALNNLELILQNHSGNKNILDIKERKNEIKKKHLLYDHDGEEHHNIISAMHESIKGYNANASLYWTTRMLAGGEDPLFIARRLVRAASEDTGNADCNALKLAISAMLACKDLDTNDNADVFLSQCSVYLARAPTNKQASIGLNLAKQLIKQSQNEQQPAVPKHLCHISPQLIELFQDDRKSCMPIGLENVNFL